MSLAAPLGSYGPGGTGAASGGTTVPPTAPPALDAFCICVSGSNWIFAGMNGSGGNNLIYTPDRGSTWIAPAVLNGLRIQALVALTSSTVLAVANATPPTYSVGTSNGTVWSAPTTFTNVTGAGPLTTRDTGGANAQAGIAASQGILVSGNDVWISTANAIWKSSTGYNGAFSNVGGSTGGLACNGGESASGTDMLFGNYDAGTGDYRAFYTVNTGGSYTTWTLSQPGLPVGTLFGSNGHPYMYGQGSGVGPTLITSSSLGGSLTTSDPFSTLSSQGMNCLINTPSNHLVAIGQGATAPAQAVCLHSSDGGVTWTAFDTPNPFQYGWAAAYDATTLLVTGHNGSWGTSSWLRITTGIT